MELQFVIKKSCTKLFSFRMTFQGTPFSFKLNIGLNYEIKLIFSYD